MNPRRLGKIDNHRQEPWKLPLPDFIEQLYQKRSGKTRPDVVLTMEQHARREEQRKAARRDAKRLADTPTEAPGNQ